MKVLCSRWALRQVLHHFPPLAPWLESEAACQTSTIPWKTPQLKVQDSEAIWVKHSRSRNPHAFWESKILLTLLTRANLKSFVVYTPTFMMSAYCSAPWSASRFQDKFFSIVLMRTQRKTQLNWKMKPLLRTKKRQLTQDTSSNLKEGKHVFKKRSKIRT